MRRAEAITDEQWAACEREQFAGLPLDWKPDNFAILDGRVVLIDYG